MKHICILALPAVLALVGALGVLLPSQGRASAADSITIRTQMDDSGNVIVQRHYSSLSRWVTVSIIDLDVPEDGDVFQYGSTALAVEFIPKARFPLPSVAGYATGYKTYNGPPRCWQEDILDEDGNVVGQTAMCDPWHRVAKVTCRWGWSATVGPFYSLVEPIQAGSWAMGICDHGPLLTEGGLRSPSGMVTLEELKLMVTVALAAAGETRALASIPVVGTQSNPIHSETTYVDIGVHPSFTGEDAPTVSVQARGGGEQQIIEIGEPTTIAIYSLAQQ